MLGYLSSSLNIYIQHTAASFFQYTFNSNPASSIYMTVYLCVLHKFSFTYQIFHILFTNKMIMHSIDLITSFFSGSVAYTKAKPISLSLHQHTNKCTFPNTTRTNNYKNSWLRIFKHFAIRALKWRLLCPHNVIQSIKMKNNE